MFGHQNTISNDDETIIVSNKDTTTVDIQQQDELPSCTLWNASKYNRTTKTHETPWYMSPIKEGETMEIPDNKNDTRYPIEESGMDQLMALFDVECRKDM